MQQNLQVQNVPEQFQEAVKADIEKRNSVETIWRKVH